MAEAGTSLSRIRLSLLVPPLESKPSVCELPLMIAALAPLLIATRP